MTAENKWQAETWSPKRACWCQLKRAAASEEEARKLVKPGKTGRLLRISEGGVKVGEAFTGGR